MTAQEVADYLNGLDRTGARPVRVTIGRTTYDGAHYWQERVIDPGCRAYREGKRSSTQRGYYLLGALPPSYRRGRVLYADPTWPVPYYLAAYYPLEQDDRTNEFHPFGLMFQLFPDSEPSLESFEDRSLRRMPMQVEWL